MKHRMPSVLITSAIIMLVCLFPTNSLVFAFGFTQFVIVIIICNVFILKGVSFSQFDKYLDDQYDEAKKNKNPIHIFAYGAAMPAIIFGTEFILIITVTLWFVKY